MKPVLEDTLMGPMASPSISQGLRFRWGDRRFYNEQVDAIYVNGKLLLVPMTMWAR